MIQGTSGAGRQDIPPVLPRTMSTGTMKPMAKRKDIEKALKKRIKTRADLDSFLGEYGGLVVHTDWEESQLIPHQIEYFAQRADTERKHNDSLSRQLNLPTFDDLEIDHMLGTRHVALWALVISGVSILISLFKDVILDWK